MQSDPNNCIWKWSLTPIIEGKTEMESDPNNHPEMESDPNNHLTPIITTPIITCQ